MHCSSRAGVTTPPAVTVSLKLTSTLTTFYTDFTKDNDESDTDDDVFVTRWCLPVMRADSGATLWWRSASPMSMTRDPSGRGCPTHSGKYRHQFITCYMAIAIKRVIDIANTEKYVPSAPLES